MKKGGLIMVLLGIIFAPGISAANFSSFLASKFSGFFNNK